MFDPRLCSPDSPVDSAMFPPVYNRSSSASSTTSMRSCPDAAPVAPATASQAVSKPMAATSFKQELMGPPDSNELEPFEFRPRPNSNPTPRSAAGTSLRSVFGDQDLIDAIMCSLNMEQNGHNHSANVAPNVAMPAIRPAAFARLPQVQVPPPQSFTALMQQRPTIVGHGSAAHGPCLRKPGTFLNKDGRWIKGKPCRMEGCDKRAQSNGLCKGHGGGARCSFAGCSKSSQGGGFCRAHGGGKRCMHEGCEKGTQRNGFCYLHGGVRSCSVEGCDKKDRGNGKCFSHGGGRKCQAHLCFNTIRRGAFCDLHNSK
ncbi:putative WRKY transcription factor 19 [Phytophthora ramorum]|uniref:WRKY19-like zinc finger domain-containing protein n=1 Tax=Phytophthora ramorum TaxID=164328 RepID=H3GIP1_PHYRM|nr:putative WRKY transcription factor 19 [Phytophthora ramorum]